MPVEPTETRRALARLLRVARVAGGHTHRSIGEVIGRSHTHAQRIERGAAPISVKEARLWLDASDADQDTRDTVLALVRAAAEETDPWLAPEGHVQAEAAARIAAADAVDSFQPHVVPGLLQTDAYCRWVGVPDGFDVNQHVAARLARQDVLKSGRRFRFVLRRRVFVAAGREQQDKVRAAVSDHVSVRVLDDDLPGYGIATIGFMIYVVSGEDVAVGMELPHGRHEVSEASNVPVYRALFEEMWEAGVQL